MFNNSADLTAQFLLKCPSIERAREVDHHTPYQNLVHTLENRSHAQNTAMVVHWFRNKDLRIQDNKSLYHASKQAQDTNKPLVCIYVYCATDLIEHGISPARMDFMLEALKDVKKQLKKLKIPLVILEAEQAQQVVTTVTQFLYTQHCSHLYINYEYEFDELKRDIKLTEVASENLSLHFYHDQSVVEPGTITSKSNKPLKVFTAYFKHWQDKIRRDPTLLHLLPEPSSNADSQQDNIAHLFNSPIPGPPESKQFQSSTEKQYIRQLWPASYEEGINRMQCFIRDKISDYHLKRSVPAADYASRMSPYFQAGLVSVREALSQVKEYNQKHTPDSSAENSPGIFAWMREIAFRDLYRQTLITVPHFAMNLPENLKFSAVNWQYDEIAWKNWCEGKTGVPFIDAGMRQLKQEAYMHNRLRMNVASYLYCNLFLDYRLGERFFADSLIDYDLANNMQGWQPSFTIFNPIIQAEKHDPQGAYIRQWVPELKHLKGKTIFDPYNRLSSKEFKALGYPKPAVDWKTTKLKAIATFKRAIEKMK